MLQKIHQCPACSSNLVGGFLGERGYLRWYDREPGRVTLMSLGFALMKLRYFGLGSYFGAVPSLRCDHCKLVIFQFENLPPVDSNRKRRKVK